MDIHESSFPKFASGLPTQALRSEFLVEGLFEPEKARFRYWETDRTVIGAICPGSSPVALPSPAALRCAFFLERREGGIINLGGPGAVTADGKEHRMERLDALYLGRGVGGVSFSSDSAAEPARFYLLSYPAHAGHPTRHVAFKESKGEKIGSASGANERMLHKLIHAGAFPTCQLVMGVTRLAPGCVWNTMPPHTHLRRSEVYLYFDVPPGQAVIHLMGEPRETRHLIVRDSEAVLSPPWSVHSGAGTSAYSFVWGMGGENQEFADMDRLEIGQIL